MHGSDTEFDTFLGILTAPFSESIDFATEGADQPVDKVVPLKKQLGFLNLVLDLAGNFGAALSTHLPRVVNIVLRLIYNAEQLLAHARDAVEDRHIPVIKSIRLLGTKRLVEICNAHVTFDFRPFQSAMYTAVVERPLAVIASESVHSPSAVLTLFEAWSADDRLHYLLSGIGDTILPETFKLLQVPSVSPEVVTVVLAIADHLLPLIVKHGKEDDIASAIIAPVIEAHVPILLESLTTLILDQGNTGALSGTQAKTGQNTVPFTTLQLSILARIAPYASDEATGTKLVDLFVPFLSRDTKIVPERTKRPILKTIAHTFGAFPQLASKHHTNLARLFNGL